MATTIVDNAGAATATAPPEILTAKQAAEFLQISVDTLKAQAAAGMIPAAKVGREWRFSRRRLLAWVEAGGYMSEALVDRGLEAVMLERDAVETDEDNLAWEDVKAELGL